MIGYFYNVQSHFVAAVHLMPIIDFAVWVALLYLTLSSEWAAPERTTWHWGTDSCGPRNHVLDGGGDWMNLFSATRGYKMAMQPVAKLLWRHVIHNIWVSK